MRPAYGDLTYEYDDITVTVRHVPMSICDACGERLIPGPIAVELSDLVDEVTTGIREGSEQQKQVAITRSIVLESQRTLAAV